MTETEWLGCTDTLQMLDLLGARLSDRKMLDLLGARLSDRKLRLFAVSCCRHIWNLLTDERSRKAVELAEYAAEDLVSPHALDAASAEAEEAFEDVISPDVASTIESREKAGAACYAASYASNSPVVRLIDAVEVMQAAAEAAADPAAEKAVQAALVRDIWGYPLRPINLNPAWQTTTVFNLAQAAYDERSLPSGELNCARLAVLSDALEEAGCADADILGHLRSPGPHVRGCWVVDLLLGKE